MPFIPLVAMVRKDLLLFFSDRRSVIVSFVVPIAIASFFGSIFAGPSNSNEPAKISIAVVALRLLSGNRNSQIAARQFSASRD